MTGRRGTRAHVRAVLMAGTALAGALGIATHAAAADAAAQATDQSTSLKEVVVTAQKREQNLQEVPIAVTAITHESMETNRIVDVNDLNMLVPNLTVRPSAGGAGLPVFTLRGALSFSSGPGSDRETAIYLDGVYIGATDASVFDLPEIDNIQVLRGPQGTLFGRNATAGAISLTTPDPTGRFGFRQEFTGGNLDQFRSKTHIDFPAWGPFSATVVYLHDEREGEVKNQAAGTVWNRTGVTVTHPIDSSPSTLGGHNNDSVFAAVKYQPTDNFKIEYKFFYFHSTYIPEAVAMLVPGSLLTTPNAFGPGQSLLAGSPVPVLSAPDGLRPSEVNNDYVVPNWETAWSHNLTATWRINDSLTLKNIFGYFHSNLFDAYDYAGVGGLVNTYAALGPVGAPLDVLPLNNYSVNNQISDEIQLNYQSKIVTITAGLTYFHIYSETGAVPGLPNNAFLGVFPNHVIPVTFNPEPATRDYNWATSYAAYIQAEVHILPQLTLVGGFRETRDEKDGTTFGPIGTSSFVYNKDLPAYVFRLDYKPWDDMLLYATYAHSFVSGGSTGGIGFLPEFADSYEVGMKAEWLEHRLRTNLALFDVTYDNLQQPVSGTSIFPPQPNLGVLTLDEGNSLARGFELETSLTPLRGVILGANLGYTDFKFTSLTPSFQLAELSTVDTFHPTLRPPWTLDLTGQYETQPVFGDARVHASIDANWRSRMRLDPLSTIPPDAPGFETFATAPPAWTVNARLALVNIKPEGAGGEMEVSVWCKNCFNDRSIEFPNVTPGLFYSALFVPGRLIGVDVSFKY